jgi:DNA-binding response OmpR family regulator
MSPNPLSCTGTTAGAFFASKGAVQRARGPVVNELPRTVRQESDRLDFAGIMLDLRREELRDATGARIDLRHRSFAVLRYLAVNAERVVTKDELLAAI